MFDIFYIGENQQVKDNLPFAKQVDSTTSINSNTKMYWLVEPNIELNDFDVLDYRPDVHDEHYEHVWKWDNTNYGGLRLLPAEENNGIKEVNKVVCKKKFDILTTKTPGKYFEKNKYATHVWCVDKDYKLGDDIDWLTEGAYVLVDHGRWSNGMNVDNDLKVYLLDNKDCLMVSDSNPMLDKNIQIFGKQIPRRPSDDASRHAITTGYVPN